jgi:hypothetical protein
MSSLAEGAAAMTQNRQRDITPNKCYKPERDNDMLTLNIEISARSDE